MTVMRMIVQDTVRSAPKALQFKCVLNTRRKDTPVLARRPISLSPNSLKDKNGFRLSKKSKTVRFASTKRVMKLYRSREDLEKSWYHSTQYSEFDRERKRTVAAVHEAHGDLSCLDPTVFTISGLEHHLYRQQMIERKAKTLNHVRSVLNQQCSNRCTGVHDPESLRYVSELFSKQPSKRAHLRGILDHTLNSMLR